ncbi:MAG: MFS transporter [Anaerolineae bacterium]
MKLATKWAKQELRIIPRNIWIVTATSFLTDISTEMIMNLIPLFLAEVLGVRTGIIGLIEGVAETTATLMKIPSGWLSDRLGQRKWLTVAGYGLSTLAKPFLFLATSWLWVLSVRFADRLGKGIRTAPRDALIADSTHAHHHGIAFGLHRAGDTAGAACGLIAALVIVWAVQGTTLTLTRATFQTVVLVSIVPATLAVLLLVVGVREARAPERSGTGVQPTTRRLPLTNLDIRFKGFLVIVVLFTLGNSSDAFLILRARERGVSVLGVLATMVAFNLVYALVSGPAGALSDRMGRRRLILGGWLVYSAIYLGFALAETTWHVVALFISYGLYYGLTEGVARALVADMVPAEQRATAYGLFSAVVGLTVLPASLIAGVLWQGIGDWQGWGVRAPFLFGAGLALLAVLLMTFWWPSLGRKEVV